MQLHDPACDREAETRTGRAQWRHALERLECALQVLRIDPDPRVQDAEPEAVPPALRCEADLAARRGVLDGVAQQVDEDLAEALGIRPDARAVAAGVRQVDPALVGQWHDLADGVRDGRSQVHGHEVHPQVVELHPRQVHEVLDQVEEMAPGPADRGRQHLRAIRVPDGGGRVGHQLGGDQDRVQGRPQLVRHVGEEPRPRRARRLEGDVGVIQLADEGEGSLVGVRVLQAHLGLAHEPPGQGLILVGERPGARLAQEVERPAGRWRHRDLEGAVPGIQQQGPRGRPLGVAAGQHGLAVGTRREHGRGPCVGHIAGGVDEGPQHRRGLADGGELQDGLLRALLDAQGPLLRLAGGCHVLEDADGLRVGAAGTKRPNRERGDGRLAGVGAQQADLDGGAPALAAQHPADEAVRRLDVVASHHHLEPPPDEVARLLVQQAAQGVVHPAPCEPGVDDAHRERSRGRHGPGVLSHGEETRDGSLGGLERRRGQGGELGDLGELRERGPQLLRHAPAAQRCPEADRHGLQQPHLVSPESRSMPPADRGEGPGHTRTAVDPHDDGVLRAHRRTLAHDRPAAVEEDAAVSSRDQVAALDWHGVGHHGEQLALGPGSDTRPEPAIPRFIEEDLGPVRAHDVAGQLEQLIEHRRAGRRSLQEASARVQIFHPLVAPPQPAPCPIRRDREEDGTREEEQLGRIAPQVDDDGHGQRGVHHGRDGAEGDGGRQRPDPERTTRRRPAHEGSHGPGPVGDDHHGGACEPPADGGAAQGRDERLEQHGRQRGPQAVSDDDDGGNRHRRTVAQEDGEGRADDVRGNDLGRREVGEARERRCRAQGQRDRLAADLEPDDGQLDQAERRDDEPDGEGRDGIRSVPPGEVRDEDADGQEVDAGDDPCGDDQGRRARAGVGSLRESRPLPGRASNRGPPGARR